MLGSALSFIGGALIIALTFFWFASNLATALANPLFDFSLVVGLVICAGASLFYLRPRSHSAWGIIVLIASLADLMGSFYFVYSPVNSTANSFTLLASVGPIVALAGSVAGMNWKPPRQTPNQQLPSS